MCFGNPAFVFRCMDLPDTDTHVCQIGADRRDATIHLASPFTCAAGCLHITELAQPFYLHYSGFWKKREGKKQ